MPVRFRLPREPVGVAVDLVILTVRRDELQVLLVERGVESFVGQLALPGGFVNAGEDLDAAAARELEEETGLDAATLHLEQVRSYGRPDRDPRLRVFAICYLALVPDVPLPTAGGDATRVAWLPVDVVLDPSTALAFDHRTMIEEAV